MLAYLTGIEGAGGGRKREKGNLKKGGITSFNTVPLCQLDVNALSEQDAQGSA